MNLVTLIPSQQGVVRPIAQESGAVNLDFRSIIEEEYEEKFGVEAEDPRRLDSYYQEIIEEDSEYFVKQLVSDWIPWIELQGERATGEVPDNQYVIQSIQNPTEVKYLKRELGDNLIIIAEKKANEGFLEEADIIIDFQDQEKGNTVLHRIMLSLLKDYRKDSVEIK